jgi:hypothetical protein
MTNEQIMALTRKCQDLQKRVESLEARGANFPVRLPHAGGSPPATVVRVSEADQTTGRRRYTGLVLTLRLEEGLSEEGPVLITESGTEEQEFYNVAEARFVEFVTTPFLVVGDEVSIRKGSNGIWFCDADPRGYL